MQTGEDAVRNWFIQGANININGVDVAFESKQGRIEVCKNVGGLPFDEDIAKRNSFRGTTLL